MSHPTRRVLLLHHTGGAVVVIQQNSIERLRRVMTQSFNGEAGLILPPKRQTDGDVMIKTVYIKAIYSYLVNDM